jgi:hypothetical protein
MEGEIFSIIFTAFYNYWLIRFTREICFKFNKYIYREQRNYPYIHATPSEFCYDGNSQRIEIYGEAVVFYFCLSSIPGFVWRDTESHETPL